MIRFRVRPWAWLPIENVIASVARQKAIPIHEDRVWNQLSFPEDAEAEKEGHERLAVRESIKIQALLAEIGSQMGMKIWIPRSDRAAVLADRLLCGFDFYHFGRR